MASVITSARTSSASIFDMFGNTAQAASQLIKTGSRSIDALDAKVNVMTASVIADSKGRSHRINHTTAITITLEALEQEEEVFRITDPGVTFDYKANYTRIHAEVLAAITE
jgi:hypothetical protein